MEKWDVYNEKYEKTGKVITNGIEGLEEGEYCLAAHIWIVNSKGEYLIQKRSSNKKAYPNMWAMTCGYVKSGEDTRDACIREVEEELGIVLTMEETCMIRRKRVDKTFVDVWLIKQDIDINDIKMEKMEVSEVKWVSEDDIHKLFKEDKFTPLGYETFKMLLTYLKFQ